MRPTFDDLLDHAGDRLEQFMRESRQRVMATLRAEGFTEGDIDVAMAWVDGEQADWVDDGMAELRAHLIDGLRTILRRQLH